MDKATKQKIESFAWDCTVGQGVDPEHVNAAPDRDACIGLHRHLGRTPTGQEIDAFAIAWARYLQEMQQP